MSVLAASNVAPPFAALVAVWSVPVPASNLLIAGIFVIAVKVIGRFVIVPFGIPVTSGYQVYSYHHYYLSNGNL